ncbi:MAG TPA: hypothetical protein VFQ75_14860, partial [Candidatus Limnocylindrales bacterium]|jgi:hypothetical protein|nr:hypothetical protein [Candidatus Limnocylindrales bacterium]
MTGSTRGTAGGPTVPALSKLGAVAMAAGLALDLVEHTLVPHLHDAVVAGFPVGEHVAHLVVLIGMVLVLVGILVDGTRTARRLSRQEGSPRNAVR